MKNNKQIIFKKIGQEFCSLIIPKNMNTRNINKAKVKY